MAEKPADKIPGLTQNLFDLQNNDEQEIHDMATIHIETLGGILFKIDSLLPSSATASTPT